MSNVNFFIRKVNRKFVKMDSDAPLHPFFYKWRDIEGRVWREELKCFPQKGQAHGTRREFPSAAWVSPFLNPLYQ